MVHYSQTSSSITALALFSFGKHPRKLWILGYANKRLTLTASFRASFNCNMFRETLYHPIKPFDTLITSCLNSTTSRLRFTTCCSHSTSRQLPLPALQIPRMTGPSFGSSRQHRQISSAENLTTTLTTPFASVRWLVEPNLAYIYILSWAYGRTASTWRWRRAISSWPRSTLTCPRMINL